MGLEVIIKVYVLSFALGHKLSSPLSAAKALAGGLTPFGSRPIPHARGK